MDNKHAVFLTQTEQTQDPSQREYILQQAVRSYLLQMLKEYLAQGEKADEC